MRSVSEDGVGDDPDGEDEDVRGREPVAGQPPSPPLRRRPHQRVLLHRRTTLCNHYAVKHFSFDFSLVNADRLSRAGAEEKTKYMNHYSILRGAGKEPAPSRAAEPPIRTEE